MYIVLAGIGHLHLAQTFMMLNLQSEQIAALFLAIWIWAGVAVKSKSRQAV